jgi:hypothetical protein
MTTLGERKETEARLLKFFLLGSRLLGPTLGGGRSPMLCSPAGSASFVSRAQSRGQNRVRVGLWGWKLGTELEHQNPSFAHRWCGFTQFRVSLLYRVPAEESCLHTLGLTGPFKSITL